MVKIIDKNRPHNFAAGPAALPACVIDQIANDVVDFEGQGISILEQGHRTPIFYEVRDKLKTNIKSLLKLGDDFHVIFLQGGARQQFGMLLLNYCQSLSPAYVDTGHWGYRASVEGEVGVYKPKILWSDRQNSYTSLPSSPIEVDGSYGFIHLTSNETIHGVQLPADPDLIVQPGNNWLALDLSSDILSRPIPMDKFGFAYACAQKNLGIVGNTIVIIRDDVLKKARQDLPPIFAYQNLVQSDSVYNTAPVLPIYTSLLMTNWIIDTFKDLKQVEAHNSKKARLLYQTIDESEGFYQGHTHTSARSDMNVIFNFTGPKSEVLGKEFKQLCKNEGFINLAGHRELGGIRVSNYNVVTYEAVESLCHLMRDFAQANG